MSLRAGVKRIGFDRRKSVLFSFKPVTRIRRKMSGETNHINHSKTASTTASDKWDLAHKSWSDHRWDISHHTWTLQDPSSLRNVVDNEKEASQVRNQVTGIINNILDELFSQLESSGTDGREVSFGVWTKTGLENTDQTSSPPEHDEGNTTPFRIPPTIYRGQEKDAIKVYRPLERDSHFRLFKLEPGKATDDHHQICGQMHIADLEDPPHYDALSYTWETVLHAATIQVDGRQFNVTQGLIEALLHLRHPTESKFIWIDQLCINQFDSIERAAQVSQMGNVFEAAGKVVMWLGKETEYSPIGMEILQFLADGRGFEKKAPWESQKPHLVNKGLSDIMTRRWWKRVWVVQEAALSSVETVIMCGSQTVRWPTDPDRIRVFVRGIKFAVVSPQWKEEGLAKDLERGLAAVNMQNMVDLLHRQLVQIRRRHQLDIERFEPDLLDIAFDVRDMESTDPRDKLYAILQLDSIRGGGHLIVPDYDKPVEKVYEELRKALLKSVQ